MKGEVVYYFAFDVASEVAVEPARQFLRESGLLVESAARLAGPRGLALPEPISIAFPGRVDAMRGQPLRTEIRLFDFGAVSIVLHTAFASGTLESLTAQLTATLADGRRPAELARELCVQVCNRLSQALVKPSPVGESESYVVLVVREMEGVDNAETWLSSHRQAVAGLLNGLPAERISTSQVDEVFRYSRSWTIADAVVLAWDAALVIDLAGSAEDVLFAIELANLQLEEFREMDRAIDRFIIQAYADQERRSFPLLGASSVLSKLRRFRIDLAKLADEVTNTTKMFGDWHLARVYLAACERFHLDNWRQSVADRLGQLDLLYNFARSELWDRRMFVVEFIIAILIVVELVVGLGFFR